MPWRETLGYDQAHRITQLNQTWDNTLPALSTRPASEATASSYDNAGQLTGVDSSLAGQDASYSYSANGNRTSAAEPGGSDGYTTGPQNRVTQDSTYSYVYDDEGNLVERRITSGNVLDQKYSWDHRNQLTQVELYVSGTLSQTIDYRYDAAGGHHTARPGRGDS